jgi:TolB-like protein
MELVMSYNDDISPETIRSQLSRILASSEFANSERLSQFLRYVVEQALSGRGKGIKGYTIGTEVYERPETFDPGRDPIVRIEAGRLRRRLKHYYHAEGRDDPISIEIPKGAYVPFFHRREGIQAAEAVRETRIVSCTEGDGELSISRKPVIAVLPFANMSGEKSTDYFANGFAEQLSIGLAQFQDLQVIAYYSTAQLKEQYPDLREIGRRLGADFIISGSTPRSESFFQLNVALSETKKGVQLWAKSINKELSTINLFEVEEEIANQTIAYVAGEYGAISRELWKASRDKNVYDLNAYEAVFHHRHCQLTQTPERHLIAREALERAVKSEPEFALVWAMLAEVYADSYVFSWFEIEDPLCQAKSFANRAIQLDPICQHAYYTLGYVHLLEKDVDEVISACEQVLALNPNNAYLVGEEVLPFG